MASENDSLLEHVARGDTLQALNLLQVDAGDPALMLNRALYGPGRDDAATRISEMDAQARASVGEPGPHQATHLYNVGCLALAQDDVMEAKLRFTEVLELQPDHIMARHNLAYAHELLAESDEARRAYEQVLAQNPACALSRLNLAQLKLQEGDFEGGVAELGTLHGEDPDNLGVLLYLCRSLLLRGTTQDLEHVLELTGEETDVSGYVDLQECRAYALFMMGDLEGAEAAFRQLLETSADNQFALAGMIKVLGQRSDFAGLKPYAERYQALNPSDATAAMLEELG